MDVVTLGIGLDYSLRWVQRASADKKAEQVESIGDMAQFLPLWLAIGVSSIAFGLGHIYQGPNGALKCGLVGVAFAVFYVLTGSIWLPIIAHALFDAGQGAAVHKLLQRDDDISDAQLGNGASSST